MGGLALLFLIVISMAITTHVQVVDQTSSVLIIPSNAQVVKANVSFSTRGDQVYLSSIPACIDLSYSTGSVALNENFSFYASVFIPAGSDIVYMSNEPIGFSSNNGLYNITFQGRNFTLLYYYNVSSVQQSSHSDLYLEGMVVSSVASVVFMFLFLRQRRGEGRRLEISETPPDQIDEKDKMIIDKIREGNYNLSKIAELTGIPRTTVYRRVKRLIKLGYLAEERKDGKVRYIVKGDGNES